MNKYQEAIDKIETQLLSAPNNDRNGYGKDFKFDDCFEDEVSVLQQLIDKLPYYLELEARNTPMKPKLFYVPTKFEKLTGLKTRYQCKRCGNIMLYKFSNDRQLNTYCWDCGQRLDWSESE